MGLDITICEKKPVICPHCNTIVKYDTIDEVVSGGKDWYEFLENIGYYVPYEKWVQNKDNSSWYGKDMQLSLEEATELVKFAKQHKVYNYYEIKRLVVDAKIEEYTVMINADW